MMLLPSSPRVLTVGGFAGTGKTYLLSYFRKTFFEQYPRKSVAFCTFTGKASSVLRNKLIEADAVYEQDFVGTIHSLIYRPLVRTDAQTGIKVIVGWERIQKDEFYRDLIIIDEASMVSKNIFLDLKSYDVPILAVGDHAQLPPVNGDFNLMEEPQFKLTEIMRQAQNSPIIQLSQFVRKHSYIPKNRVMSGNDVITASWKREDCRNFFMNKIDFSNPDIITLCAFNKTRSHLNKVIRKKLGHKGVQPYPGERVICLNNNRRIGIMNGQLCTVVFVMPEDQNLLRLTVQLDGTNDYIECLSPQENFGRIQYNFHDHNKKQVAQKEYAMDAGMSLVHFDYGYCTSVHKSQGSEWNKVILFEQFTRYWNREDFTRWLYTAVTRAKEKLFVISSYYV